MISTMPTKTAARRSLSMLALLLLAVASTGCAAATDLDVDDELSTSQEALSRPSRPPNVIDCDGRQCTCDKSIENECAEMSARCTDESIDDLIDCINGWGTTHCSCPTAKVAPTPPTGPTRPTRPTGPLAPHAPVGSIGGAVTE
jgi:hypothetical protein